MNKRIETRAGSEIKLPEPRQLEQLLTPSNIQHARLLGEGSHGIVLQVGNLAVKIGFHFGLEENWAQIIANIAYPNQVGPKVRIRKQLNNSLAGLASYEKQVLAHSIGNATCPQLIDAHTVATIVFKGKIIGMTLPVYTGKFMSISDKKFNFTRIERILLESAGIQIDDFQHRKNAVILTTGQRKIFDITLRHR